MKEKDLVKLLDWATGDDTGISSNAICRHMLGYEKAGGWGWNMAAPSDSGDRGRCIRLLNLIPQWWDRLYELEDYGISWTEQIKLLEKERKNYD